MEIMNHLKKQKMTEKTFHLAYVKLETEKEPFYQLILANDEYDAMYEVKRHYTAKRMPFEKIQIIETLIAKL